MFAHHCVNVECPDPHVKIGVNGLVYCLAFLTVKNSSSMWVCFRIPSPLK